MDTTNLWVCEFSPEQDCFHVDELHRALALNRNAVWSGHNPGYLPLAICETEDAACDFARIWRQKLEMRRQGE